MRLITPSKSYRFGFSPYKDHTEKYFSNGSRQPIRYENCNGTITIWYDGNINSKKKNDSKNINIKKNALVKVFQFCILCVATNQRKQGKILFSKTTACQMPP